jgi:hypothetical protein
VLEAIHVRGQPIGVVGTGLPATLKKVWSDSETGSGAHQNNTFQFFRVPKSVEQSNCATHGMAAKNNIFVTAGGDETTNPFQVTFNIVAGLARRMARKVNGFGIPKVAQLVVVAKAGAAGSVEENEFHYYKLFCLILTIGNNDIDGSLLSTV